MSRGVVLSVVLFVVVSLLWMLNLVVGSVSIPLHDVCASLVGGGEAGEVRESWRYIVCESRLPQATTALLSGAALAVSGLLLQTAFRNPLAGPDVFGINSGASLAVALVMLGMGGSVAMGEFTVTGYVAVLLAAFVGAMVVTAVIFFFSTVVRSHTLLLIIGLMIGYVASSVVSLLNFFATEEGVKSYMVWGMGQFGNATTADIPLFAAVTLLGLLLSVLMVKPLNVLLLGDLYAENLGVNIRRLRHLLLVITGLLTAVVTAFCGPIAFIGLATPHVARLLLGTDNHRQLLPVTLLMGAGIALVCNVICVLPSNGETLPLNAVTPLFGAPVIIYVIARKRQ